MGVARTTILLHRPSRRMPLERARKPQDRVEGPGWYFGSSECFRWPIIASNRVSQNETGILRFDLARKGTAARAPGIRPPEGTPRTYTDKLESAARARVVAELQTKFAATGRTTIGLTFPAEHARILWFACTSRSRQGHPAAGVPGNRRFCGFWGGAAGPCGPAKVSFHARVSASAQRV